MRRVLMAGGAIVVLLAIIAWSVVARSGSDGSAVTVEAIGPAPRVGDDAGYTVRYTNPSGQAVTNPQFRTVLRLGEQDWTCQGYHDPATGNDVLGTDAETQPLSLPARQDLQVTIYCRIPADVALDSAQILQRP